jgi:hypothetical protein
VSLLLELVPQVYDCGALQGLLEMNLDRRVTFVYSAAHHCDDVLLLSIYVIRENLSTGCDEHCVLLLKRVLLLRLLL